MRKLLSFFACFLLLSISCLAQEEVIIDSLSVVDSTISEVVVSDTLPKKKKSGPIRNFFRKGYPNPTKAMVFSVVIPGAGQLYNKKYWKVPIVFGTYGLMIYFIDFSSDQYRYFRDEYIKVVDGDESTTSDLVIVRGWGEDDIKEWRDLYRKRMELSYIGLAAVMVLSGVDAYVDAHLAGFDVSEDLTMQIRPKFDYVPSEGSTLGLGINLRLSSNTKNQPKFFFTQP